LGSNIESAPEASKILLEKSQKKISGMIPGLHGVLAGSPGILEATKATSTIYLCDSSSMKKN
jgi:hypothetical protein